MDLLRTGVVPGSALASLTPVTTVPAPGHVCHPATKRTLRGLLAELAPAQGGEAHSVRLLRGDSGRNRSCPDATGAGIYHWSYRREAGPLPNRHCRQRGVASPLGD